MNNLNISSFLRTISFIAIILTCAGILFSLFHTKDRHILKRPCYPRIEHNISRVYVEGSNKPHEVYFRIGNIHKK